MPRTGIYCPVCERVGEKQSEMRQSGTSMVCPRGHVFTDMAELLAMGPRIERVRPAVQTQQLGFVPLTLMVPPEMKKVLEERFGETLSASLMALASRLVERGSFVVSRAEAESLSQLLREKIASGQQLVTAVRLMANRLGELETEIRGMRGMAAQTAPLQATTVLEAVLEALRRAQTASAAPAGTTLASPADAGTGPAESAPGVSQKPEEPGVTAQPYAVTTVPEPMTAPPETVQTETVQTEGEAEEPQTDVPSANTEPTVADDSVNEDLLRLLQMLR
jgi:hypothetical protein